MGDVTRLPLPDPTPATRDRLTAQLAQRHGPEWDPILRIADIAENPDWPKSLRLDALKTVAKYVRPQYQAIPDQASLDGQRPTIVIVDHTRSELLVNAPQGARAAREAMSPAETQVLEGEVEPSPTPGSFDSLFGEF